MCKSRKRVLEKKVKKLQEEFYTEVCAIKFLLSLEVVGSNPSKGIFF